MPKQHSRQSRALYDWIDQPVVNYLRSHRTSYDKAFVVKKRTKQTTKVIAWATGASSQKNIKFTVSVVPINNIRNPKYELIKPMCAIIEYDNDSPDVVTATCYDADGLFGSGVSELEATEDLCRLIIEVFEDLVDSSGENLGPTAKILKEYLTQVIKKRNAA